MWLTSVSIRRPVFISMFVLALVILGWQSLNRMPAELYPDIEFPFISVVTVYPGAGPQEIETLVSEPIEEALSSVGNLRELMSTSQDGISIVSMQLELGTDLEAAAADVRDKLSAARGGLPGDIEEPTVFKADVSAMPVLTIGLYGSQSPRELRHLADTSIKDRLSSIGGVASVSVNGGDVREIAVDVDRDRLDAYGVSILSVANAIRSENLTLPAGAIKESTREYAVRAVGEFESAEQIRDIRISIPDSRGGPASLVRLGDIADVRDTVEESGTYTRLNGRDAVVLAVQKQADANTITVAERVKEALHELEERLPSGVKIVIATDDSIFVEDALHDAQRALFEGIFLVVTIVFLFLHRGRATFIVALAIPTSIFATFLPMWAFGFTLNMMTLLALALVVGILVDDSIVVLENIERHLRMGKAPPKAALDGRSEIGLAAIAITLVDVVVFIPVAFMGGIVGQFFRQFGITVATATLFSLFVSFTLAPMLASRWLKAHGSDPEQPERNGTGGLVSRANRGAGRFFERFDRFYSALDARYRGVLVWALENRFLTVVIGAMSLLVVVAMLMPQPETLSPAWAPRLIIAGLALGLSLAAARHASGKKIALGFGITMVILALFVRFPMGGEMLPRVDEGNFSVFIEAPAGSSLVATDQVVRRAEAILAEVPEMEYYLTTVGASSAGGFFAGDQGSQYARISAKLVDAAERKRGVEDIVQWVNSRTALLPGASLLVSATERMGGGGEQPIQMEIVGSDMDDIVRTSELVRQAIEEKVPSAVDVQTSWKVGKPELQVTVDRLRASELGVSVGEIATAMRTAIEGDTGSKFREGGDEYDIRVRLARSERQTPADVSNIIVGHANGAPVYLRDVAGVELMPAPQKIQRSNRQRLVTVGAEIRRGYSLANVQREIDLAIKEVPTGTAAISTGGMSEIFIQSFQYLIAALLLSIVLVYMLMAALFESLASPLIVMFSLPQAMVGALLALMLTGNTISIISMIGIIMLMGLVSKNGILLVDYTNTLRSRGKSRDEAILEAGPTRLKPILMTTFAMVGGLLPTAIALTRGAELRSPMAIAVIGGLLLSMFLTLLVIPSVYTIVDDLATRYRRRVAPVEEEFGLESEKVPVEPGE